MVKMGEAVELVIEYVRHLPPQQCLTTSPFTAFTPPNSIGRFLLHRRVLPCKMMFDRLYRFLAREDAQQLSLINATMIPFRGKCNAL